MECGIVLSVGWLHRDFHTPEKASDFFQWALGCGEADALDWLFCEGFEALQREGEVSSALGGNEGVDLVDDDGVDGAEGVGSLGGEQEVERLGGGDEDVGGLAAEACALALWGVSGADADERLVERDAAAAGHVGDAGERRTQVALDINGEGLEGGDVDDAATRFGGWRRVVSHISGPRAPVDVGHLVAGQIVEHETVEAPEEGGEGFSCAGGGEDECAFAAGDDGPAEALRRGGRVKYGAEPLCRDGMEAGEGVGSRVRVGRVRGHA